MKQIKPQVEPFYLLGLETKVMLLESNVAELQDYNLNLMSKLSSLEIELATVKEKQNKKKWGRK